MNMLLKSPFKHLIMTIGELPTTFVESMSYYEALCWLVNYIEKNIIPAVNENAEALKELKEFVENYFDNLDVQEEINNKLDEMAESGQLADIVAQYLNATAIISFDSIADMKASENLNDGSFVETYGYHQKGDGGSSLYKIRQVTNQDVEDDMEIIALYDTQLVAVFVPRNSELFPEQFGAYGDGTHDDTQALVKSLSYAKNNSMKLIVNKSYVISSSLDINTTGLYIEGIVSGKMTEDSANQTKPTFIWTGSGYLFEGDTFVNNLTIKNVYIKGNGENSGIHDTGFKNNYLNIVMYDLDSGFYFDRGEATWRGEITIENSFFEKFATAAIVINGVMDSKISGCYFKGEGYSISGTFMSWLFESNHDYSYLGINVTAGVHSQILNNYFDHSRTLPMISLRSNSVNSVMICNNKFMAGEQIENLDNNGIININNADWGAEFNITGNVVNGTTQNNSFIKFTGQSMVKLTCNNNTIANVCNKVLEGLIPESYNNSPQLTVQAQASGTTFDKNFVYLANGRMELDIDIISAPASITLPFRGITTTRVPILNGTDKTCAFGTVGRYVDGVFSNTDTLYIPSDFQGKRVIVNGIVPVYTGNGLKI